MLFKVLIFSVVRSKAWDVRDWAQELNTRKGVKQFKLVIVTP